MACTAQSTEPSSPNCTPCSVGMTLTIPDAVNSPRISSYRPRSEGSLTALLTTSILTTKPCPASIPTVYASPAGASFVG